MRVVLIYLVYCQSIVYQSSKLQTTMTICICFLHLYYLYYLMSSFIQDLVYSVSILHPFIRLCLSDLTVVINLLFSLLPRCSGVSEKILVILQWFINVFYHSFLLSLLLLIVSNYFRSLLTYGSKSEID